MAYDVSSRVAQLVAAGEPCAVATVVRCEPPTSARAGDKAVITGEGRLEGWIGGSCAEPLVRREALRALADGQPRLVRIVPGDSFEGSPSRPGELTMATTCPSGGSLEVFVDPQLPPPLLAVYGDSPAARALVATGGIAGFRTCALDSGRLDLAPANPGPDTWVIVATMGHYDEDALAAALAHPEADVALVASERRAAAVLEALRRRGMSEDALARVRIPAGRVHGATQEEIAVLALAEVIALRRARGEGALEGPSGDWFATDPVCGMPVEVEGALHTLVADGGETLYFCSAGCMESYRHSAVSP